MRYVARQTRETARQAAVATTALKQAAYQSMLAGQTEYRALYINTPSMMEWYLRSRGYDVGSEENNKRTLFALVRLNTHESTFLGHAGGLLDDDIWGGWRNVIRTDFAIPEFRSVWPRAKLFYAPSFVAFVDREIIPAAATVPERVEDDRS